MASAAGKAGVCVSGHPEVTGAAGDVLAAGGNAFDGVVAAGFASAVCEPALTSLGGGGFLLAHAEDRSVLFDFFVDTPGRGLAKEQLHAPHFESVTIHFSGASQDFRIGLGSVGVPGSVAGLLHVHQRLGRMPLKEVVAPAVALARDGVRLEPLQAMTFGLLAPILNCVPEGEALFSEGGKPRQAGSLARNPKLADFLEHLPESARSLYGGHLAEQIEEEMLATGGLLTRDDLAAYKVIEREPLRRTYRGKTVLLNPAPALGGRMIALMLHLLEAAGDVPGPVLSPSHIARLAAVMREAERLRNAGVLSPDDLNDAQRTTAQEHIRVSSGGTTHLTVVDRDGQVASLTTSNGEGSGHFAPGTGIMLNNMLGEEDLHPSGFHQDPPGMRVASMMAPTVVLNEDGSLLAALGSGGSKRIRTAVTQTLSHVVDLGLPLSEAVALPRVHVEDGRVHLEGGYEEATRAHLIEQGFDVNAWTGRDLFFGGVHAAAHGQAAPDPRRGGTARLVP
jgi:gamma-glutamyltranspeptidase/glutathione hydrolase